MIPLSFYKCKKCGTEWRYIPKSNKCDCGNHINLDTCTLEV